MKKIVLLVFAVLLVFGPVFLIMAPEVYATPVITPGTDPITIGIEDGISRIFNTGFWLLMGIASLFFLYGAYLFIIPSGDGKGPEKAKTVITYAIIALVVAVLARGLAAFIPRMFGITITP